MQQRKHDWRFDGILKMKLQGSDARSIKILQTAHIARAGLNLHFQLVA
jgi:hypothetical protein